jgi:four helix bundle protein
MSKAIKSFRDLSAWQRSIDLFVSVTGLVRRLPLADRFVFETQIRRSALSVAANIAEGHERFHLGDYLRSLSISRGELAEVETHLIAIQRTTNAKAEQLAECLSLADEAGRKIYRLGKSLRDKR